MASDGLITQDQLNSLLSSLSGMAPQRRVHRDRLARSVHEARVHDFARSDALPRANMQTLETVHTVFARSLTLNLSTYLRSTVQVSLLSADQLTYDQFVRSVPDPTVVAILAVSPLAGKAIFELNSALAFWTVDRLLGGEGEVLKNPRPLTLVERAILEMPISRILTDLGAAWQDLVPIRPRLVELVDSAATAQIAKPTDAVIAISFEVSMGTITGMATFCLPVASLRLGLAGGSGPHPASPAAQPAEPGAAAVDGRKGVAAALARTPVECKIRLGKVNISAADLAHLEAGDLVLLDTAPTDSLEVLVGNRGKFRCRPGVVSGKLVVKITERCYPGREEHGR